MGLGIFEKNAFCCRGRIFFTKSFFRVSYRITLGLSCQHVCLITFVTFMLEFDENSAKLKGTISGCHCLRRE